jgi:tetratricopeptide (TPR) repeat protein
MLKKILFMIMGVLLVAACASLPEKEYKEAQSNREVISKHSLNTYYPDDYTQAEQNYAEGEKNYDKDNGKAKKEFDAANALYQKIISNAFPMRVDDRKKNTDSSRDKAKEIKADVAVKDDYAKADEAYQKALALSQEGKYEEALVQLDEAIVLFDSAYESAKGKHDKAQDSITSAQDRINKLDEINRKLEEESSKESTSEESTEEESPQEEYQEEENY